MTTKLILGSPISQSILIHLGLFFIYLALQFKPNIKKKIDFEVIQYPIQVASPTVAIKPPTEEIKPKPPEKRAVFGVSRKAITATESSDNAAEVKQGNTVAKEQDDLTLDKDDADSLPIPADDFLISQMPKLKSEVRIPYPVEAKKAGIEGPVVMDLLIDDQGKVRQVELIKGPGFGLNEAALAALKSFEFTPARIADKNVAVKIRYTYRFVLESR